MEITHDKRRNSITPQIFKRHGINTPTIHPSLTPLCPDDCSSTIFPSSYRIREKKELFYFSNKFASLSSICSINFVRNLYLKATRRFYSISSDRIISIFANMHESYWFMSIFYCAINYYWIGLWNGIAQKQNIQYVSYWSDSNIYSIHLIHFS